MKSFVRYGILASAAVLVASFAAGAHPTVQNTHTKTRGIAQNSNRALSVLYDQSSNGSGAGTISEITDGLHTSWAADDFTVPANTSWTIDEIDVAGAYVGTGAPESVQVLIYRNAGHKPRLFKFDFGVRPVSDNSGSYVLDVSSNKVRLKPGRYWLSIQANVGVGNTVDWYWENQTLGTTEGYRAVWTNPADGYGTGCVGWTIEPKCTDTAKGDHIFVLKGKAT